MGESGNSRMNSVFQAKTGTAYACFQRTIEIDTHL
jgi:hypothetical protein